MNPPAFGIRAKLVGLLVGVSAVVILIVCAAFVGYDRHSYSQAKSQTMTVLGDAIAGSAGGPVAFRDEGSAAYVLETLSAEPTAQFAGIYIKSPDEPNTDGTLLASWGTEGQAAPEQLPATDGGYANGRLLIRRPISTPQGEVGTLVMALSTADIDARTKQQTLMALAILLASVLSVTGLASVVHSVITGPVEALVSGTRKVQEESDYGVRVEKTSNDELGELAQAFNQMLEGIQDRDRELLGNQQQLEERVAVRTADLAKRNEAMRVVLDNVDQGLVVLDLDGVMAEERSAAFARWFPGGLGAKLAEQIAARSPKDGEWFELCWESLQDGFLPTELALAQLPSELCLNGAHYRLQFKGLEHDGELAEVLVIVSDVTSQVAQAREQERQQAFVSLVSSVLRNPKSTKDFLDDSDTLVGMIAGADGPSSLLQRQIHTLKGNTACYGLEHIARTCHTLESRMADGEGLDSASQAKLVHDWQDLRAELDGIVNGQADLVQVSAEELSATLRSMEEAGQVGFARIVASWQNPPIAQRLEVLGRQAEAVARRLGRPEPSLEVRAEAREIPEHAAIWPTLVHVIRNAMDHGVEAPEERLAAGKPAQGRISLSVSWEEQPSAAGPVLGELPASAWCLRIQDDGRGVNWERICAKGEALGLPSETESDRLALLFTQGLSSRDEVGMSSGRGVGMSAVLIAVQELGGAVSLESHEGQGSCWSFWLPGVSDQMRLAS